MTKIHRGKVMLDGQTYSMAELASLARHKYHNQITAPTIQKRLENGWNVLDAITKHTYIERAKLYELNGQQYSIRELVDLAQRKYHNKLAYATIYKRLSDGWSAKDAVRIGRARQTGSKIYQYSGHQYSLAQLRDLAKRRYDLDLSPQVIFARINRQHWPVGKAISTPAEKPDLSSLTPEERRQRLSKQQMRYYKKHPDTYYKTNYLSTVRSYLRNHASEDDLREALAKVNAKLAEFNNEKAVKTND